MKKFISIILALTLIVSAFCLYPSAEVSTIGDADANGEITASDALRILQYAVGKTSENGNDLIYFNVDAKDMITAADALLVLQFAVGKINTFPAVNKFTGYIYADSTVTVYKGQAVLIPISAYGLDTFSLDYSCGKNDPVYVNWGKWISGSDIALMVSAYDNIKSNTSVDIKVCFSGTDISRNIKVTAVSQSPADADYMFAPGVKDFGVYTKTSPYQMECYLDESQRLTYKMVYNGLSVSNNSGNTRILVDYLDSLGDQGFLANDQSGSGKNWHYDIENEHYRITVDLVTNSEETVQNVVFVITELD